MVDEFDPPEGSLRASVSRGAVNTGVAQALQVVAQILSVLMLSRLLSPGDFGLVAMVGPVVAFLAMLQDFGLVQATVQKKNLQRGEINSLFWINVGGSLGMSILLIAISPLVGSFYQEPRVAMLTAAMSAPMLIGAIGAQHIALLNRRMEFGRLAAITITSTVFTLATAIIWALFSPTYWALFASSLANAVASTGLAWALCRWRPDRPRISSNAKELLRFGAGITGFNFANFFARNLDNVLIGRVWGQQQLGFYDRAYKLLLMPLSQISNPLSRVMVPALSRLIDEPSRYRHAYFRVLNLSLFAILPGVAFATGTADTLIPLVLGDKWQASAPIFMALGCAGLVQPLNNPVGWLFISQGRSTEFMIWGLVTAAVAVTAFMLGLAWGAVGVAVAYAVSEYIKTPLLWRYISRSGPVRSADALRICGPTLLGAHVSLLVVYAARDAITGAGLLGLALAAVGSYVITVLIAACFPAGRATISEAGDLATGGLSRARRMVIR